MQNTSNYSELTVGQLKSLDINALSQAKKQIKKTADQHQILQSPKSVT